MPRPNETLLRMAGIGLMLTLVPVAARYALRPPKNAPTLSAAVPSAEDLEQLGTYMTPAKMQELPVISGGLGTPVNGLDPFASRDYAAPADSASAAAVPVRERNVVSAILIANDRRIAVIDETLVSIGSMLPGGFRVTGIERDHIEIVTPRGVTRWLTVRDPDGQ